MFIAECLTSCRSVPEVHEAMSLGNSHGSEILNDRSINHCSRYEIWSLCVLSAGLSNLSDSQLRVYSMTTGPHSDKKKEV